MSSWKVAKLRKLGKLSVGLVQETAASLISLKLYPLGLWGENLPVIRKTMGRAPTKPNPILFIHGVFHGTAFNYLAQRLHWEGWNHLKQVHLFTTLQSVESMAEKVRSRVHNILSQSESNRIDIIAHSLGGLLARKYVQQLGGDKYVSNLVTIGTPHQGTVLSKFSVFPQLKELHPQSSTIQELNRLDPPENTQILSISGSLDPFTKPGDSGWWPGVRNIELTGLGHVGMLFSKRVFELIASRLESHVV